MTRAVAREVDRVLLRNIRMTMACVSVLLIITVIMALSIALTPVLRVLMNMRVMVLNRINDE